MKTVFSQELYKACDQTESIALDYIWQQQIKECCIADKENKKNKK